MGRSPEDGEQDIDDVLDDDTEDTEEEKDTGRKGSSRVKELSDENARRRNNEKKLTEQLEAAMDKLQKFEDEGKSETQRVADELEKVKQSNEKLIEQNTTLQLENAFLSNTQFKWRNPKTALRLLDTSEVEVDDEGKMSGLDEAIKNLAEAEPYLLADGGGDNEDEDLDDALPTGQRARRQKNNGPSREDLVSKFPALRR